MTPITAISFDGKEFQVGDRMVCTGVGKGEMVGTVLFLSELTAQLRFDNPDGKAPFNYSVAYPHILRKEN